MENSAAPLIMEWLDYLIVVVHASRNNVDVTFEVAGGQRAGARREWYKVAIRCVVGAPPREKEQCPTPFDCTASWLRSPIKSIAPSLRLTPWPSGCHPTALPARCNTLTRKSAAPSGCLRNFTTGMSHSFGGEYLELVPGEHKGFAGCFYF